MKTNFLKVCKLLIFMAGMSCSNLLAQNFIEPGHGESIGTVQALPYSEANVRFSTFDEWSTPYVANPSQGIYLGFREHTEYLEDNYDTPYITYELSAIASTQDEVTIPDKIEVKGIAREVSQIFWDATYIKDWESDSKVLTVPSSIKDIYNYRYDYGTELITFYMLGKNPFQNPFYNSIIYIKDQSEFDAYRKDQQLLESLILPYGWDFDWITVNVSSPGQFAQIYLQNNKNDWSLARNLRVTGSLNSTDLSRFKEFPNLYKLDLTGTDITSLPDNFLYSQKNIVEVSLSDKVTSIGRMAFYYTGLMTLNANGIVDLKELAFYYCKYLKSINFSLVKNIDNQCFYNNSSLCEAILPNIEIINSSAFSHCSRLTKVVLSEKLLKIGNSAFSNTKIPSIEIPSGVKVIEEYTFNNCASLQEVTLNEGLQEIATNAFCGCKALQSIYLPSTLNNIGSSAFYESGIKEISCAAVLPPLAKYSFMDNQQALSATLYVPKISINTYRTSNYWKNLAIMLPLDGKVDFINVTRAFELDSDISQEISQDVTINLGFENSQDEWYPSTIGQLDIYGQGVISIGSFNYKGILGRGNSLYYENSYYPTLINHGTAITAKEISQTLYFSDNLKWYFISLPYDAKVMDILPSADTHWTIRRYDGALRASGLNGETWVTLTNKDLLEGGKGYICILDKEYDYSVQSPYMTDYSGALTFKSYNNSGDKFFNNNDVEVELSQYESEFAHNQSWNLIGNPYPCYYDISALKDNFSAPITIWNGSSYSAYSPLDDQWVLQPFEAFFVQAPKEVEKLTFGSEGRIHSVWSGYSTRTEDMKNTNESSRSIFNFNILGDNIVDRARIVLNPDASPKYEIGRDAAKFFNEESEATQIFVKSNTLYSIDERPRGDGFATLGIRSGVKSTCTLNLNGNFSNDWKVVVKDNFTGKEVDLTQNDYTFEAEEGENPTRFSLTFLNDNNSEAGMQEMGEDLHPYNYVEVTNLVGITVYKGPAAEIKVPSEGIYILYDGKRAQKIMLK